MLGVAGYSSGRSATISELAEFLQERVHSVVGLVGRAERKGLVRSRKSKKDHPVVVVSLTGNGATILSRLCRIHYTEANRMEGFRGYQFRPSLMPGSRK
jgi:DNA-binding MarR family transcriptional regulator